jgi:N-acetylglutamate synthase-like GNAT family acetyltransferase
VTKRKSPTLRSATPADARRIHELVGRNLKDGHLLPRELNELTAHAERFVVACDGRGAIVGCAELAPLSHSLGEVRSLVVAHTRRSGGVGRQLVTEIRRRARVDGYDELCVFAHQPAYFVHMGFSIVPHTWLPEKIATDCSGCALFRRCGQYALVTSLDSRLDEAAERAVHV